MIIDVRHLIGLIYQDVKSGNYDLNTNDKEDVRSSIETLKDILT